MFVYVAHQSSIIPLYPLHAEVDDDIEQNDAHPHSVANQLKLSLPQKSIVTVKAAEDCEANCR